jgi:hypothetical protein
LGCPCTAVLFKRSSKVVSRSRSWGVMSAFPRKVAGFR